MPRLATHSLGRADWLAARALLATRRLRPLVPATLGVVAVVLLGAGWWLRAAQERAQPSEPPRTAPTVVDTLAVHSSQEMAQAALRRLDSLPPPARDARVADAINEPPPADQLQRDSLVEVLEALDAALDRAAKSPLTTSYRALARTPALQSLGSVSVLVDTLDLLDEVRRTLDPVAAPQREFAQLSERTHAIGASLQAIGQARRAALNRRLTLLRQDGAPAAGANAVTWQATKDSLQRQVGLADSLLRAARQGPTNHAAPVETIPTDLRAIAVALIPALGALCLAGVTVFTLVLIVEARRPTIAHGREAERVSGLPVLATIHESRLPTEGRARLRADGGADPFRMVYLSLTVGEPRVRTVCVTGDDPSLVAATAGQLAVHAAAEERSTLVMDLAAGGVTTAQYFGWKDEPGFTEAIAGVRLWREVATPIGASEGTDIDLVAAGTPRADTAEAVAAEANRREFLAFLAEHDFTVLAAPTTVAATLAANAAQQPCTVLIARTAKTRLEQLRAMTDELKALDVKLSGLLLFDR